jgi:hypothetical protein
MTTTTPTGAALAITGIDQFGVAVTQEALAFQEEALALAFGVFQVTNEEEQGKAVTVAGVLKTLAKACEKSRAEVKAPVLNAGRMIDTAAREYLAPLETEVRRLESLAARFVREKQAELERQRRAAEEAARAEALKAEQARRAEEEAARKVREAATLAERLAAKAEAAKHAEASEQQAQVFAVAAARIATPVASVAVAGASVSQVWDFEILDLAKLAACSPDLVDITPRRARILSALKEGRTIPGIHAFQETKVAARTH